MALELKRGPAEAQPTAFAEYPAALRLEPDDA